MSAMKFVKGLTLSGSLLCAASSVIAQEAMPAIPADSFQKPVATAAASQALNNLFVHQWVQARPSGELMGRVVRLRGETSMPAATMRVALTQGNQVVSETMSNTDGSFALTNVQPGMYTIVSRGDNTVGAFSLVVVPPEAGHYLPAEVAIPVANVMENSLQSMVSTQAGAIPLGLYNQSGSIVDPLGESRTDMIRDYKVYLNDEVLKGRLSNPGIAPVDTNITGTTVALFQDGREVARTRTDLNGDYEFRSLKPGCYGLVANGPSGFAAFGFCAAERGRELSQNAALRAAGYVSAVQDGASSLNGELGNSDAVSVVDQYQLVPNQPELPLAVGPFGGPPPFAGAGGGFGGGGAGGGGGLFGGGGGLGRFLPLLALGGVAAAIAADDNNNNNGPFIPVVPASPVRTGNSDN